MESRFNLIRLDFTLLYIHEGDEDIYLLLWLNINSLSITRSVSLSYTWDIEHDWNRTNHQGRNSVELVEIQFDVIPSRC